MKGVASPFNAVLHPALVADAAFVADWLLENTTARSAMAIIPSGTSRKFAHL
ncbi:hypothetical protein [Vannielia sp.]|uniref:hypothetical protein n=1 Tax=Vannielia sp. TaxID=2813045 RepID=UPI002601A3DB|nr:hypothetical protein [Vannielia sp.]MDF1873165.1 hypothetical protein [Vannielia sp.]